MKIDTCTDQVVSELVANLLPAACTAREKHLLREALNGLVRLAKSEQVLEMKNTVRHLTGPLPVINPRARLRPAFPGADCNWQQQFEF